MIFKKTGPMNVVQAIMTDIAQRRNVIYNGVAWETEMSRALRRIRALEKHIIDLELRYSYLEGKFNEHSKGVNHRPPKAKLPDPDVET